MKKSLCSGKGSLASCISRFINLSRPIIEKYPNPPKEHNLENLVLIAEAKNTIQINSGVNNVHKFLHADFKGVKFYSVRGYVNLTKEGRQEDLFVSD